MAGQERTEGLQNAARRRFWVPRAAGYFPFRLVLRPPSRQVRPTSPSSGPRGRQVLPPPATPPRRRAAPPGPRRRKTRALPPGRRGPGAQAAASRAPPRAQPARARAAGRAGRPGARRRAVLQGAAHLAPSAPAPRRPPRGPAPPPARLRQPSAAPAGPLSSAGARRRTMGSRGDRE